MRWRSIHEISARHPTHQASTHARCSSLFTPGHIPTLAATPPFFPLIRGTQTKFPFSASFLPFWLESLVTLTYLSFFFLLTLSSHLRDQILLLQGISSFPFDRAELTKFSYSLAKPTFTSFLYSEPLRKPARTRYICT